MPDYALELLQSYLPDSHLPLFAQRLTKWLLDEAEVETDSFTESRARALLRASDAIDDLTLKDFLQRMAQSTTVRLALYTLLNETNLAEDDTIVALAAATRAMPIPQSQPSLYLLLPIAAYAYQRGYPLAQLDPAHPPAEFSPAGQIVKRSGGWIRQQTLRTATERDKLLRLLAYKGPDGQSVVAPFEGLPGQPVVAPVPPYYRPPVPVRYPEVNNETLQVDPEESEEPTVVSTTSPIKITEDDIAPPPPQTAQPARMPAIKISEEQVQSTGQRIQQRVVQPTMSGASAFATAVQKQWSSSREPMTTTKLRVVVQEYPDGPALYGLQVRISCRGVRTSVAGTTNRNGVFLAELPVRAQSGLTYDVQIDWPRDFGGEKERKSITLNAERTQFELPFYQKHNP